MSGTILYKPRCPLPSTHQKLQVSCIEIFSGSFLKDEKFVSKTINDSNIDLDKFPSSKVRQLAKKMESSKSTTEHIKAVASDPQAAEVNLMRYQRTDLPPSKAKQKQHSHQSRSKSNKRYSSEHKTQRPSFKTFNPSQAHKRRDRCSKCWDSKHVESFKFPARKFQCKTCNIYGHFSSLCYKKQSFFKSRNPKSHQLQVGVVYVQVDSICSQSSDLTSSDESFCLLVKIQCTQANTKFPTPHYLITNLAYWLKPHHKRNQYLRARLDTCANVSIMSAIVYKLVFHNPNCKKFAPSRLEIGTYTTDTVKLVGSCMFYLVHPDSKCLLEVTSYVASNNGNVLLSCATTLALGLIQPRSRLDYLTLDPVWLLAVLTPKEDQVPN